MGEYVAAFSFAQSDIVLESFEKPSSIDEFFLLPIGRPDGTGKIIQKWFSTS